MSLPPYPPVPGYGFPPPPPPVDPRQVQHPHPEPRPFDEMLRTWDYAWWRALAGALTLVAGVVFVMPIVLLSVLAVAVGLEHHHDFLKAFEDAATAKVVTPASMLYLNLVLASAILVSWFNVRVYHRLRPRWLSSVRPGMRWRLFVPYLGVALVALGAQLLMGLVLPDGGDEPTGHPHHLTGKLVAIGLVILLTTPLQAAGEEYAFRGYLTQAIGSVAGALADSRGARRRAWVRGLAIVVPAILFALAHGAQNWPLFGDRLLFGLCAGYVAVRTGGLEAGIVMHAMNNLVAFGVPLFFGDIDSTLQVTDVSWWQLPMSVAQNGIFVVLALWVARRKGVQTRTAPPVLEDADPTR